MRFIRSFVILSTICLLLAVACPIYATDSYFSVAGCSDDPTQLCTASGDGVSTNVHLSQIVSWTLANLAELLGPKATTWGGKLWPKDSYRIGKDKLNIYGSQVQTASDTDLNPAELQEKEIHDQNDKKWSMTSRLCVYDPSTGNLVNEGVVSTTTIKETQIPWAKEKVEGDRRLSSFTTRYVQESQDFRLQPVIIRQDAALRCRLTVEGDAKTQNNEAYRDDNTYGDGIFGQGITFIINIIQGMYSIIHHDDGSPDEYTAAPTINAEIVGTGQNYPTGHDSALSAGCATPSDLDDVTYATAEQKQKLCEAGGVVNSMYRPDAIDPTYTSKLDADDPDQWWIQTVTVGGDVRAENSNAFAARVEAASDYMNCTLMPADYQATVLPNGECNKNWVNSTPSDNGTVCEVAKAYNIPCCQLQGVMEIETGGGTYMGKESCSTNHGTFQCCHGIACGPAGVLCGQYNAFAGNDNLDLCSPVGTAELLARAMLLKLCQADGKCDSYDWIKWGEFVKKNYKVNDGDYTATAYFYGLAHGCIVSACSQYRWGPGKGYCDSVASYCTTGQILPDNTSPQFCEDCNKEIIRAHQTPIQCP